MDWTGLGSSPYAIKNTKEEDQATKFIILESVNKQQIWGRIYSQNLLTWAEHISMN